VIFKLDYKGDPISFLNVLLHKKKSIVKTIELQTDVFYLITYQSLNDCDFFLIFNFLKKKKKEKRKN
jgi:hypothetical protein